MSDTRPELVDVHGLVHRHGCTTPGSQVGTVGPTGWVLRGCPECKSTALTRLDEWKNGVCENGLTARSGAPGAPKNQGGAGR